MYIIKVNNEGKIKYMKQGIYIKNLEKLLGNNHNLVRRLKISYCEKNKEYLLTDGNNRIFCDVLSLKEYIKVKKDMKIYCEKNMCLDAFKMLDPNIWNLLSEYQKKYQDVLNIDYKNKYANSMKNEKNYEKVPFRIIYNMQKKFPKPIKLALVNSNIKKQNKLQDKMNSKFMVEEFKNNQLSKNNNKHILKKIGAFLLAGLAGTAVFFGRQSNINKKNIDNNTFKEFNIDDNNTNDSQDDFTKIINEDTSIQAETTEITTETTTINSKIQNSTINSEYKSETTTENMPKDKNIKNDSNSNIVNKKQEDANIILKSNNGITIEQKKMNEKINVGDEINIISDDALYYIDSQGSGTPYSFNSLKKEYKIKKVYAEYVTDKGIVHGVGITENNEEIHFGWFGENVKLQKVQEINDCER